MNKDEMQGTGNMMLGKIKETWGRLTSDDVALYNGKRDQFFGKLQEKYGVMREEAEDKLNEMEASCGCSSSSKGRAA